MKYYRAITDGDEFSRNKRDFFPFVAKLDNKFDSFDLQIKKGLELKSWDENISFYSCQDGNPDSKLANDSDWLIFSDYTIELFKKNNIKGFQFLPISVFKTDGKKLDGYNYTANITNCIECLDVEKSGCLFFGKERPDRQGEIKYISKGILQSSVLKNNDLDVFRLKEYKIWIVVSERLVKIFKDNNFTGMSFNKIEMK